METLIKADIFFFITAVAVVLMTLVGLVALFYVIRFARMAFLISKKIKSESDNISHDIAMIRAKVQEDGFGIRTMISLFKGFFGNSLGKTRKKKATKAKTEDEE